MLKLNKALQTKWQWISTVVLLTLVGLFVGATPPAAYAATCTTTVGGTWNDPTTWTGCGGIAPTAADEVVINHPVILNTSPTVVNVTINSGGTLAAGSFTLDVKGNWTNDGTFSAAHGSIVNFNGMGAQTIGGTNITTFNIMNISNGGRTVTFGNDVIIKAQSSWTGTSCAALLSIRSSVSGTQRKVTLTYWPVTQVADYISVADSHALPGITIANGRYSGSVTNWSITTTCPLPTPTPTPVAPKAVGGVAELISMPTASTNGLSYLAGLAGVVMLVGAGWLVSQR